MGLAVSEEDDMTKKKIDHSKDGRVERAKGRTRGMMIALVARDPDEAEMFRMVADENAALVTDADVKQWMEDSGYIGTVYPIRFARGKESIRRSFSRVKQETFKTVMT